MPDYVDRIASYVSQTSFHDLPLEVVLRAKEVLADSLAVIAAGAQEDEVKKLRDRLIAQGGRRVATMVGTGMRSEPGKAALFNGTAGTFLELDEGNQFGRGHPGIHVIPAALAAAEEKHLSGRDLVTALVLGYEIGTRIGIACKIRMSMHPHGTWGTVGAAVAVGKLMGYQEPLMKEMINVSSSLGLATSRRTMLEGGTIRNVYAGVSGYMGVLAHDLVQSGFTGEADGLKTIYGSVVSDTFNSEAMTEELGKRFEITRNYFKMHACCRYNHGTLDALGHIVDKRPVKPEEIARVDVETYSLAAQLCDQSPENMLAAKFSIPFAVATFVVHGHGGVACFKPEALQDPVIRALARKVEVSEDPQLTAMMPSRRPSRVRVTLASGEKLEAQVFMNRGDFEDPYPVEELKRKYYELADVAWGHERAEELYGSVMSFEKVEDVNEITRLIAPMA
ncbi:MAG: MmgE/PrpD family protein [Syntrophales bacterium LBB04]|nr:MmgE/PrpD family protein [Syntrophales bacterium LBB04]